MGEDAGIVTLSNSGAVVIPVEVREVLGIKNQEALIRLPEVEVAEKTKGHTPNRTESAGVVRISEDGVAVIPVEVRDLLGVDNTKAYLRLRDISVAKKLDEGDV
ncbi:MULTISPECIES: AbrB/MazE/SpoVT family DNA-binding domain-containing protein [Halobacterium]|uniref:AbrB/MazE/SpoVT family DNA-binding domain-containing protein n=1 Tax=Halobacterium TaxID=2239 RepID=UPI00073E6498|nr:MULTISPECIES: AbrB/MazE/SpoVT family DNA-binding domain-containing protein [Halobacterium]MCG1004799.1 AbrB/MazE/SpoVT family DNA-binding domain-containing protein [Halobacterium noricense]